MCLQRSLRGIQYFDYPQSVITTAQWALTRLYAFEEMLTFQSKGFTDFDITKNTEKPQSCKSREVSVCADARMDQGMRIYGHRHENHSAT